MLINIVNTDISSWEDHSQRVIRAPYFEYSKCYPLGIYDDCWETYIEYEDFSIMEEEYNLILDQWYRRFINVPIPTSPPDPYHYQQIIGDGIPIDSIPVPIFLDENDDLLLGYLNPLFQLYGLDFELTNFQKTINNDLIIDFKIKNQLWKLEVDGWIKNNPLDLYFQVSYDYPNNIDCMYTFPNEDEKNNTIHSGNELNFRMDFSICDYPPTNDAEIYFSFSAYNYGDDIGNSDPVLEQEYIMQFNLIDGYEEDIYFDDSSIVDIKYVIAGESNSNIGSLEDAYDYSYENYSFTLSEQIQNIDSYDYIYEVINIEYDDDLMNKELLLPDSLLMEGHGNYEGVNINLDLVKNYSNNYSYVVADKTYYDVYADEIVINQSHNEYPSYDGLVIKKNVKDSSNDYFDLKINANGYTNREFKIEIPFRVEENFIELNQLSDEQAQNLTYYDILQIEEKSFSNWIYNIEKIIFERGDYEE